MKYIVIICWEFFIYYSLMKCVLVIVFHPHFLWKPKPHVHFIYHNLKYRSTTCVYVRERQKKKIQKRKKNITWTHFWSRSRAVNCLKKDFFFAPLSPQLYSCKSRECIIYDWFTHWFSYANRQKNRYHHISTNIKMYRVSQSVSLSVCIVTPEHITFSTHMSRICDEVTLACLARVHRVMKFTNRME